MKRFCYLLVILIGMMVSACSEDEPVLIFHEHSGTYSIGGNKSLVVTLDGVKVTEKNAHVVFETKDNKLAQIGIMDVIPGHGEIQVGGVELSELPGGNGLSFTGEAVISQTEKIVFSGTVINMALTLDIKRLPLSQPTTADHATSI